MGMFAFRRLREQEAASKEVASLSIAEPTLIPTEPDNGSSNRGDTKRRQRHTAPLPPSPGPATPPPTPLATW
jgi:hypothetical protein